MALTGIYYPDETIDTDPSSWDDVPDEEQYLCLPFPDARDFLVSILIMLERLREVYVTTGSSTDVIDNIIKEARGYLHEVGDVI